MAAEPIALYLEALALGLGAAAPIGPVNIEIIRRGLTIGPLSALLIGLGAVTADCVYFGVAFSATELASGFLGSPWGRGAAFGAGGAMLGWLGIGSLRSAFRESDASSALMRAGQAVQNGTDASDESGGPRKGTLRNRGVARAYVVGLAMTLMNPMTIVFWLSVAASFSAGHANGSPLLRLGGVATGALGWVIFLVALIALVRRRLGPRFVRGVNLASGVFLIGFGLKFWVQALLG